MSEFIIISKCFNGEYINSNCIDSNEPISFKFCMMCMTHVVENSLVLASDIILSCYSTDESDIDLSDIHGSIGDSEEPETLDLRQQPAASLENQSLEFKVEPSCRKRPRNPIDNSQYYHQDELDSYRKRQKLTMQHYYDEAYYVAEKKMRNPFLDESLMKPLDSFENYARGSLNPINYTLTAEAINRRIRSTLGLEDDSSVNYDRQRPPSNDECCTANPDWLMRRGTYVGSQFPIASSQIDTSPSSFAHDDNNNVDKKLFQ